jgi:hypothetical protein
MLLAFDEHDVDGPAYTYIVYWLALPDHEARMVALLPSGVFPLNRVIDRLNGAITLLVGIVVELTEEVDVVYVV